MSTVPAWSGIGESVSVGETDCSEMVRSMVRWKNTAGQLRSRRTAERFCGCFCSFFFLCFFFFFSSDAVVSFGIKFSAVLVRSEL